MPLNATVLFSAALTLTIAAGASAQSIQIISLDDELTPIPGMEIRDHIRSSGPALSDFGLAYGAWLGYVGTIGGSRGGVLVGDESDTFEVTMRTLEGEQDGTPPVGEYFSSFIDDTPGITDNGLVAQIADIANSPQPGNPPALIVHDVLSGDRREIWRDGDVPVGTTLPAYFGSNFEVQALNSSWQATMPAYLGDSSLYGIVTGNGTPGSFRLVALEGEPIGPSGTFDTIYWPVMNEVGDIAFLSRLTGAVGGLSSFPYVICRESGGTLEEVARDGDLDPLGFVINDLGYGAPSINDAGDIAAWARIDTELHGVDPYSVIRFNAGGSSNRIMIGGDQAPGGEGLTFSHTAGRTLVINNASQVAFKTLVNVHSRGTARAIFRSDGPSGSLVNIAMAGEPAPGGGTYRTLEDYDMNDSGQVAFQSTINMPGGSTEEGIFFYDGDGVELVVRTGDFLCGRLVYDVEFAGTDTTERTPAERSGLNDLGEVGFAFRFDSFQGPEGVAIWGTSEESCPADLTGDGVVDAFDLAQLLAAWGTPAADLDCDGITGTGDLAVVLAAWGNC